jgi:voltage-gated potassium channel
VGILLAGAAGFSLTDHVSYGTGLYWALTTATTVGYGNVTPANTASRIVAAVVMLTTIPIVGAVFALGSGAAAVSRIRRMLGMDNHLPRRPYTIVFGTHPVVARVLDELVGTDDQAVLVAPDKPAALDPKVHFLAGDPTDEAIIRRCDLSRANRALIACTADADTLSHRRGHPYPGPGSGGVRPHPLLVGGPGPARAGRDQNPVQRRAGRAYAGQEPGDTAGRGPPPVPGRLDPVLPQADAGRGRPGLPALSRARATAGRLVLGIAREQHVDLGGGEDPVLDAGDRLVVLEALPGS